MPSLCSRAGLRADIAAIDRDIKRIQAAGGAFVHSLDPTMTGRETLAALRRIRDIKEMALWRLRLCPPSRIWWRE